MIESARYRDGVARALGVLGIRRLVFGIQDPAFPPGRGADLGRGSYCSGAGRELLRFARDAGFNGLQFGPQGLTPGHTASPYEGALFSRNVLSICLGDLTERSGEWGGILPEKELEEAAAAKPEAPDGRALYGFVYRTCRDLLGKAFSAFEEARSRRTAGAVDLARRVGEFRDEHRTWMERDALYEVLQRRYGAADSRLWRGGPMAAADRRLWHPPPGEEGRCRRRRRQIAEGNRREMELYAFCQYVAHRQHERFREEMNNMGLRIYGDLQVGFSDRDTWGWRALFLPGYRMGAPPSRTNPGGQPWGYPVLHPALFLEGDAPGPVLRFLAARMRKVFAEYDGVRVDHPHGLVCPWVYREDAGDPREAVLHGARLFSSPDLPDHPDLRPFAVSGRRQLNPDPSTHRYADDWVVEVTEEQAGRYGILFDTLVQSALGSGRSTADIVPEVLSSLPFPLERVLRLYGLGRFRVTHKADPRSRGDVYRSDKAHPEDWVMTGTHDTSTLWSALDEWRAGGALRDRAEYLARRLEPDPNRREGFALRLRSDPFLLAQAQFADLFAGPAVNVMVFFTDFFGLKESYNRPGIVSEENWSLRLPRTWKEDYLLKASRREAMNLPLALAFALHARPDLDGGGDGGLARELFTLAGSAGPA